MNTINAFLDLPIYGQALVAFVLLFIAFVLVIEIQLFCIRLEKKGGRYSRLGNVILISFGLLFLVADAAVNIVYMPLIFREFANKYGEGWLVTDRVSFHKKSPGIYYQKTLSIFICGKLLEKVDPQHCE
jgi:hypothetical protein